MANGAVSAARVGDRPLTGILFKIASVAVFVAMQSFIKAAGDVPAGQIVFYRSFFALFPILLFLGYQGELRSGFRTARPFGHIYRGVIGVAAMGLGFFALTRLPLPEAIALNYAQPLLVVAFSALFLGEPVRAYRWGAVIVGLIGVVIVSWPKFSLLGGEGLGNQQLAGVIAALVAAAFSAVAVLQVRSLVATEASATIVLWFSLMACVLSLLSIPFGWQALSPQQYALLISAGFDGHREDDMAQFGLVEADYAWITERVMDVAARHAGGRIVSVLEGGYDLSALGRSAATHVKTLAGL